MPLDPFGAACSSCCCSRVSDGVSVSASASGFRFRFRETGEWDLERVRREVRVRFDGSACRDESAKLDLRAVRGLD
jgi:hypothetical protein